MLPDQGYLDKEIGMVAGQTYLVTFSSCSTRLLLMIRLRLRYEYSSNCFARVPTAVPLVSRGIDSIFDLGYHNISFKMFPLQICFQAFKNARARQLFT